MVAQQFRGAGAWAQASAKERTLIGWLSGSASKVAGLFADDFVEGMLELGYIQGRDFEMVWIGSKLSRKRLSVSSLT